MAVIAVRGPAEDVRGKALVAAGAFPARTDPGFGADFLVPIGIDGLGPVQSAPKAAAHRGRAR